MDKQEVNKFKKKYKVSETQSKEKKNTKEFRENYVYNSKVIIRKLSKDKTE